MSGKGRAFNALMELGDKALDMSKEARMARAGDQGYYYARRNGMDSPLNSEGWGMFYRHPSDDPNLALEKVAHYGDKMWLSHDADAVDAEELMPAIAESFRNRGLDADYGISAEELARAAAPEDIIDSAGLWDSQPDLFNAVWDDVLEPRGIFAVRTPDGLIRFSESGTRSVNAAFDPAKKDSANLLASLVGGGVLTGAALNPENAAASTRPQSDLQNRLALLASNPNVDLSQNAMAVDGYPLLLQLADGVDNYTKSPLGGSHLQGITDLLRKWGYREQATPVDYGMAALDVMP